MHYSEEHFIAYVTAMVALTGNIHWSIGKRSIGSPEDEDEGLSVCFPVSQEKSVHWLLKRAGKAAQENKIAWLKITEKATEIDLDELFAFFPDLPRHTWLRGRVKPRIEVESKDTLLFGGMQKESNLFFIVTRKEVEEAMPKRIFLSHKGINKLFVRSYANALRGIGFDPWLDEDAMVAGIPLERALHAGMKHSCATVFFVTPDYVDENYLATEINYALEQKRAKGDKFAIITLVFRDERGLLGVVPEVLQQFVWKQPKNDLEAINEILRALPIKMDQVSWKA